MIEYIPNVEMEVLESLRNAKNTMRSLEETSQITQIPVLTEELLRQLTNRAKSNYKNFNDFDILKFHFYSNPCGCLGAIDDELYCNCIMGNLLEEYKYDVAIQLKILDLINQ